MVEKNRRKARKIGAIMENNLYLKMFTKLEQGNKMNTVLVV
jgi:hypothetical protein